MRRVQNDLVMWADAMEGNAVRQLERLFDKVRLEVYQLQQYVVTVHVYVRHRGRDYAYTTVFDTNTVSDSRYYAECLRAEYPRRVVREVTDYILRGV